MNWLVVIFILYFVTQISIINKYYYYTTTILHDRTVGSELSFGLSLVHPVACSLARLFVQNQD